MPDARQMYARPIALVRASFRNASALWVFAFIFVLFSLWVPDTFLTTSTWRTLLDAQATTAMIAVGLIIPLAAGAFDLAVGAEVGLGAIFVAWLLHKGIPIGASTALAIVAGLGIGTIAGLLIIRARIDSFIATLGVSSILLALISWISGGTQIVGLSSSFQTLANNQIAGIVLPVYLMLIVSAAVYYVLEHTAVGRRVYATGGNPQAARLAGVRTSSIVVGSLAASGAIACLAGVLVSSNLGTGDPTIGPAYLLPAFSAAFLGSTQFRGGRFNVWGTVVAVYVLATGVKGLQLAGAPTWIPDLFNGVALLVAVGLAKYERSARRGAAIGRITRTSDRPPPGAPASEPASEPGSIAPPETPIDGSNDAGSSTGQTMVNRNPL